MRPLGSTAVASSITTPAPDIGSVMAFCRCHFVGSPSTAEYWHIGEIAMRFGTMRGPVSIGVKSKAMDSFLREARLKPMLGWSARHAIRKPDGHALTLVSVLRRPVARAKRGNPAPQPPAVPYFADRCARFPGFALEPCPDRFRGRAPDDGSLQRNRRDVILECRTLRDHRIPALEMFELRPLRHQLPEPIGHDADRNIAHRECRAGDEGLLRERGFENLHCIGGLRLR